MKGLDFESERYVRIYVRDTADFCLLSWEAQAVHLALQRKLDRAGVLELGGNSAARAVAAVLRWPPQVVDLAVGELLDVGLYQLSPGFLVDPTFVEAQEANQNDAARARASRERRRAKASAEAAGLPVTNCDESVRGSEALTEAGGSEDPTPIQPQSSSVTSCDADVTDCDTRSRSGRKRHSVPSRAVPNRAQESTSTAVDTPGATVDPGKKKTRSKKGGTQCPEDFEPDPSVLRLAAELGFSRELESSTRAEFVDWWRGDGGTKADWQATYRNWLRRNAERRGLRPPADSAEVADYQRRRREAEREPEHPAPPPPELLAAVGGLFRGQR